MKGKLLKFPYFLFICEHEGKAYNNLKKAEHRHALL